MRVSSVAARSLFLRSAFAPAMIPRIIPHFIEIERNSCRCLGIKSPLNRGVCCALATGVENRLLCGMRSSEPLFILASTVVSREHESESYESLILSNRVKLQLEGQFSRCSIWIIFRVSSPSWRRYCSHENVGSDSFLQLSTA
jgi:hypothetical protein